MWRKFEIPASEDVIRSAAKIHLDAVLEKSGKKKTQLSKEWFNCASALQRFINGNKFSHKRLRILIAGFDAILKEDEVAAADKAE
ncbi:MAG: hypothetical protein JKX76_00145 [Colwellia sp.]|nr:hypothetical protein [Colwellia sp.]